MGRQVIERRERIREEKTSLFIGAKRGEGDLKRKIEG